MALPLRVPGRLSEGTTGLAEILSIGTTGGLFPEEADSDVGVEGIAGLSVDGESSVDGVGSTYCARLPESLGFDGD